MWTSAGVAVDVRSPPLPPYAETSKFVKNAALYKGAARNFSRRGPTAIFGRPGGGGATRVFWGFNGQNERISRAMGGHGPSLPMPGGALGTLSTFKPFKPDFHNIAVSILRYDVKKKLAPASLLNKYMYEKQDSFCLALY